MKRFLIRLGFHGYRHRLVTVKKEHAASMLAAYWFWQGESGHEINEQGRMK